MPRKVNIHKSTPFKQAVKNALVTFDSSDDDGENDSNKSRNSSVNIEANKRRKSLVNFDDQPLKSAISGLSDVEMAEHYKLCIKLSSENKITKKNAFGLHLIDYLSSMVKKETEKPNFQIASITLHASTKIYAARVDLLHSEVLKVSGGLHSAAHSLDGQGSEKKNDSNDDDEHDEKQAKINKRKKVVRKTHVLKDTSSIDQTAAETVVAESEGKHQLLTKAFEESGMMGLMYISRIKDDSCKILLFEDDDQQPEPQAESYTSLEFSETEIAAIQHLNKLDEAEISPTISSFSFVEPWPLFANSFSEFNEPSAFVNCDNNASIFNQAGALSNDMQEDMAVGCDDSAMPDSGAEPFSPDCEMEGHFAETNPSLGFFQDPSSKTTSSLELSTDTRKRKKAEKKPFKIDFHCKNDSFKKKLAAGNRLCCTKKTQNDWKSKTNTLPEGRYLLKWTERLFLKPANQPKKPKASVELDRTIGQYDYQNLNDTQNFCPDLGAADVDMDDDDPPPTEEPTAAQQVDPNLVEMPQMVKKDFIPYVKQMKKINPQKIKVIMWNLLRKAEKNKNASVPKTMTEEMSFRDMYNNLKKHLSPKEKEDLSVPIAFVLLLHLTNEQSLYLKNNQDSRDITIFPPHVDLT